MKTYHKNDPSSIQKMFGSIATKYDRANAILSLQMHKYWNAQLVKLIAAQPDVTPWLDLCCGTGDIAWTHLKKAKNPQAAILVDFCPEMLECAKTKASHCDLQRHDITYIQADVQYLPLQDAQVSVATIAYGIRNVKTPIRCFQEVFRILKPQGVLGILELTTPSNPLIRMGHRFYLNIILPYLGKWITSNEEAYQYLCHSIQEFATPAHLEQQLYAAGFKKVVRKPLAFGIATILVAYKM